MNEGQRERGDGRERSDNNRRGIDRTDTLPGQHNGRRLLPNYLLNRAHTKCVVYQYWMRITSVYPGISVMRVCRKPRTIGSFK